MFILGLVIANKVLLTPFESTVVFVVDFVAVVVDFVVVVVIDVVVVYFVVVVALEFGHRCVSNS